MLKTQAPNALAVAISAYIIVFFFAWVHLQNLLDSKDTKLNTDNLTPADYTVMLTGVPTDKLTADEFRNEVEAHVASTLRQHTNVPVRIAKVCYTYDLTPFTEKVMDLRKKRQIKAVIDQFRVTYKKKMEAQSITVTDDDLAKVIPETRNSAINNLP